MRNINCLNIQREIEEAGSADLLSAAAISHLDACAACEKLSRQQTKLQAIVSSLATVEAPGDFDFRLRARLAAEKHGGARSLPFANLSFGLRSVAVAAILLLIGSAIVFVAFNSSSDNPVAGGKQVAPKPVTPDSEPKQIVVPGSETPGPNQLAAESKKDESAPIGPSFRPVGQAPKGRGLRNQFATLKAGHRFETRDLSGTRPPVWTRDDQFAESFPTAAFPIDASYQSLKLSVDNGRGTSRTISLPSVSFGSQRTLSQNTSPIMARGSW